MKYKIQGLQRNWIPRTLFFVLVFCFSNALNAATYTWDGNGTAGSWTDQNNWTPISPVGGPVSTDNIIIQTGASVPNITAATTVNSLTINSSSITFGLGGNLTVTTFVLIESGATFSTGPSIGPFNFGSCTVNGTLSYGTAITVNVSGNFGGAVTGVIDMSTGGSLNLSGPTNNFSGDLIEGNGTVNYNANGAQSVFSASYRNLGLQTSGTKTLIGTIAFSVSGNLTIRDAGTEFNLGAFTSSINVTGSTNMTIGTPSFNFGGLPAKTANIAALSGAGVGTIIMQGAPHNLNISGNATLQTLTTTDGDGSTINYMGSGAQSIFASTRYQNLNLSITGIKTIANNIRVNGHLTINNATLAAGIRNIELVGNWTNNGTYTVSSGILRFMGNAPQFITGTSGNVGNIDVTNTAGLVSTSVALSATNTSIALNAKLDLGFTTGHTLGNLNGAGTLRITSTGPPAQVPAGGSGTFYTSTGILEFYGNAVNYQIPSLTAYVLLITETSTKTLGGGITVNKDFIIAASANVFATAAPINLLGDFTQDGSFISATSNITFQNPSADQYVKGTGSPNMTDVTINKAAGKVVLNAPLFVGGVLNLQNGILDVQNFDLNMSSSASTTNYGPANYVLTNGSGGMAYQIGPPMSYVFPVANNGKYSLATFNYTSGSISAGTYVKVIVANGEDPNVQEPAVSLAPHWAVSTNSFSNITGSFDFTYDVTSVQGTEASYVPAKFSGTWTSGAPASINIATNTVTFPFTTETNIDGGYTAGEITAFSFSEFYSVANGDWDTPTTWAYGNYGAATCNCLPTVGSVVHIGNGFTVTKSSVTNYTLDSLIVDATGVLNITALANTITTDVLSNKGAGGNGIIRIDNASFIAATANDFCNSMGGTAWGTVDFTGGTYTLPGLTMFPNLTISGAGGNTKTLSANLIVLNNLLVMGSNIFDIGAASAVNVSGTTTVNGSNTLRFATGSQTFTSMGDFICNGGLDMSTGSGHLLDLRGVNNTIASLSSGTSTIRYGSASNQLMSNFSNGYFNLHITGGSTKTLRSAAEVYGVLQMNSGILDMGNFDFTLMPTSSISGPFSATNNIKAAGTGTLTMNMTGLGGVYNRTIPIATASSYMPMDINLSAFTSTNGSITIKPMNGVHPSIVTPAVALLGHWNIVSSGLSGINGSLSFTYPAPQVQGTEANYISGYHNGTWQTGTAADVDEATNIITFNKAGAATLTGGYTAGEPTAFAAAPTITTSNPLPGTSCAGSLMGVNYTLTGTFNGTNSFMVELSTAAGVFPGPVIGTVTNTNTQVTINATIPPGSTTSSAYRVRVVSTDPMIVGAPSGTFTIHSTVTPGSINGVQSYCTPTNPTILNSVSAATGGSGVYNYQWESSTDNVSFTAIGGATAVTYDPPTPIAVTTYYRRAVTSGACATPVFTTSVMVEILPPLANNTISANQTLCAPANPALLPGTFPTGGNGVYTYQWESAPDGVVWSAIAGATTQNYDPPVIPATTHYRRRVASGSCANNFSAPIIMTVNDAATSNAGIDQAICANNAIAGLAGAASNYSSTVWSTSGSGTFGNANALTTTYSASAGDILAGTVTLTLTANGNLPCGNVTDTKIISITPAPTANAGANQTICSSTASVTLAGVVTVATGGVWTGGAGTFAPGNTTLNASYTPSAAERTAGTVTLTLTTTGMGSCNAVNDPMTITINPTPATPAISGPVNVCQAASGTYTTPFTAGSTYTWTVPGFASISTGQGTSSLTMNVAGSGAGSVSVTETNSFLCVSSVGAFAINGRALPTINSITGSAYGCNGANGTYNATATGNSFNWTAPGTLGSVSAGQGTNSINFIYGTTSGILSMQETTSFGCVGPINTLGITIETIPAQPGAITGPLTPCANTISMPYNVPNDVTASSYTWSYTGTGASFSGTTNSVTVNYAAATDGNIEVFASNVCGDSPSQSLAIDIQNAPAPLTTISGSTAYCDNTTGHIFSVGSEAGVTYNWVYTGTGASFGGTTSTISVDFGPGATSGSLTVEGSNGCGTTAMESLTLTINTVPTQPVAINGSATVCDASISNPYDVSPDPMATNYFWNYTGTGATIGGSTNTVSINFGTGATDGNLEVTLQNACGSAPVQTLAIDVINVPAMPSIIGGNLTPCEGTTANNYSVLFDADAAAYSWNFTGTGATYFSTTNAVDIDYAIGATDGTLEVTASNGCGSSPTQTSSIVLYRVPAQPSIISGPITNCVSTTVNYSVTNDPMATSYVWNYSGIATVNNLGNQADLIFSVAATTGTLQVQAQNFCGVSIAQTMIVDAIAAPAAPSVITGATLTCQGVSGYGYSVVNDPTVSYNWSYSGTGHTILGGPVDAVTVDYSATATSGNLSVTAQNACGASTASVITISVNDVPATPSAISGNVTVCENTSGHVYSIINDPTVSFYTWSYTGSGASVGGTTNSISVSYTVGSTSGNMEVIAQNSCGTSAASSVAVSVLTIPATPSAISGSTAVCDNITNVAFNVTNDPNATNYDWTYSGAGATILGTTNAVTIDFFSATNGDVQVIAQNSCGISSPSILSVTIVTAPATPGTITGSSTACTSTSGLAYSVTNDPTAFAYVWSYTGTGHTINGTTSNSTLDFNAVATSGDLTVTASNACGNSPASAPFPITINAIPLQPSAISGNVAPCENTTANLYDVTNDPSVVFYNWTYSGTGAAFGGTSNVLSIDYATASTSGTLQVTAHNTCGASSPSMLNITIKTLPTTPGAFTTSNPLVCQGSSYPYAVNSDPNVDFYNWTYSGAGISFSSNINAISATYSLTATSGDISVTAQNACGVSSPSILTVTVNNLPAQPSVITGPDSVCAGQTGVFYSVVNDPMATNYTFVYSGAGFAITQMGLSTCSLDVAMASTSGTLSISAVNTCGTSLSSDLDIAVLNVPVAPPGFTGSLTACDNTTGNSYSVSNDPSATYAWSYTGAGATINGASFSAITVDFASATNGDLTVTASNMCGTSTPTTNTIAISPAPNTGLGLDVPSDTVCFNNAASVGILNSENGVTYRAFIGALPVSANASGNGGTINLSIPYAQLSPALNTITIQATGVACSTSVTLINTKDIHASAHNTSLPAQTSTFGSLCNGGDVTFGVGLTAGFTYSWWVDGSQIVGQNSNSLTIIVPGNYSLRITDNYRCEAISSNFNVAIGITPPTVSQNSNNGVSANLQSSNITDAIFQWYAVTANGNKRIQDKDELTYTAYYSGDYYVLAAVDGCFIPSNILSVGSMAAGSLDRHLLNVDNETISIPVPDFSKALSLYPNPSSGSFTVNYIRSTSEATSIELYNTMGKRIYEQAINESGFTLSEVQVPNAAAGLYQVVIREGEKTTYTTIVLQ